MLRIRIALKKKKEFLLSGLYCNVRCNHLIRWKEGMEELFLACLQSQQGVSGYKHEKSYKMKSAAQHINKCVAHKKCLSMHVKKCM